MEMASISAPKSKMSWTIFGNKIMSISVTRPIGAIAIQRSTPTWWTIEWMRVYTLSHHID